jgi:hypothetical protein
VEEDIAAAVTTQAEEGLLVRAGGGGDRCRRRGPDLEFVLVAVGDHGKVAGGALRFASVD